MNLLQRAGLAFGVTTALALGGWGILNTGPLEIPLPNSDYSVCLVTEEEARKSGRFRREHSHRTTWFAYTYSRRVAAIASVGGPSVESQYSSDDLNRDKCIGTLIIKNGKQLSEYSLAEYRLRGYYETLIKNRK